MRKRKRKGMRRRRSRRRRRKRRRRNIRRRDEEVEDKRKKKEKGKDKGDELTLCSWFLLLALPFASYLVGQERGVEGEGQGPKANGESKT